MLIFVKIQLSNVNYYLNFLNIGQVIDSIQEKIFWESIAILFKELLTLIGKILYNWT